MTTSSFTSSFTTLNYYSSAKSQQYMDSLIPPSRDQFEHIAHVQESKEEEIRQRVREQRHRSHQESRRSLQSNRSDERSDAARVIQKTFRGYRARREMSGFTLDPSTRWITAIREAQFRETTRPRGRSFTGASQDTLPLGDVPDLHSSARLNWKKLSMIALRAGHDDEEEESDSDSSSDSGNISPREKEEVRRLREEANARRKKTALTLGLQYWLEIVDQKHRYGTNLRMYHEEWRKADTNENFFYWLDYGEGRYISLDTCPRDRLERDQVRYLSREERQYYLATVDDQGRLCWAKNGEPIDTSEKYRDSINGIVPVDDPAPPYRPTTEHPNPYADSISGLVSSASTSSADSNHEQRRADRHINSAPDQRDVKKVKQFSATTTLNKLLRKTVRDGTWIFVADTNFRLYIGIKQAGAFQHSSFLQGARISAGGLIGIKEGKLSFLSPLSGHYRPPTSNFRAFVRSLKAEGVDVGHVPISKAYAVLLGLETYTKTRRVGKDLVHKMIHRKNKVIHPKEMKKKEQDEIDTSKSAQKERQIVATEKQQAEAEKQARVEETAMRAMEKLHLLPTAAAGQETPDRAVTHL
ncbi:iq calmodulin-binding motif [Trichoderma arundinaceum]|uniref:Iq calmodulin-binding motif n=1 Tax=Trichoderma arundinaceum TaxID=490622 RepID=A0A395NNZ5_TRIAR|nr:iq calmodulin-binding motif [Trichoderma arundinaceum]